MTAPNHIEAGNRKIILGDYISLRCYMMVAFVVFLHRLDPSKIVVVKAKDIPGWARKGVRDAFRFYRERVKYSIDF